MDNINQQPNQNALLERSIKLNKRRIVMDLIVISMFLFGLYYIVSNIEFAKVMNGDVCRICEEKTGGLCQISWESPQGKDSSFQVNLST